jgi:hypothetical protein
LNPLRTGGLLLVKGMRDSEPDVAGHLSSKVGAADSMVTRCAWCGRLEFGGHWTQVDEAPFFDEFLDRCVTHGICEDCLRALERSGESLPLHE